MGIAIPKTFEPLKSSNHKKEFFLKHIFHERHMNSCPIGCKGCAVSASTTNKGSLNYENLLDFYKEAADLGVSLSITKVEGYDPAFVQYADNSEISFAQSIVDTIDNGHKIITPICTTGSWKNSRSQWQMEELGKLSNDYRYYQYPSGKSGNAVVLSVPREINPFAGGKKYDIVSHVEKVLADLERLSVNGKVDALIYFNSKVDGDKEIAEEIKARVAPQLSNDKVANIQLLITDFNTETLPESCYRYENSVLFSDKGFIHIDPVIMDWNI
ncbi:MAG: hypothetical protein HRT47_05375 [Candidatus Caenarcaniphilales bacterium]|nr:hypothetical protein [Candidatus Caenarcaniphilales bacterium]